MSNGGRLDDNEFDEKKNRVASDVFGRAISKVAVAQICERVGFQSFNDSALEALADITIRYLRDLGKTAKFYANVANRTECNVFDIIQGLEDLGSSTGFSGGSEVCASLVQSGAVKEIMEYVEVIEEVPFAQPVPSFPVIRHRRGTPSFIQMGETPAFKHVPEWLPAFPDPHTYIHSPVWNERQSDPRSDKVELARQRRKAENSLLSLQKRLLSSGSAIASTSEVANGSKKSRFLAVASSSAEVLDGQTVSKLAESENPFLAPALPTKRMNEPHVENPFSSAEVLDGQTVLKLAESENPFLVPDLPTKHMNKTHVENHVSLLETFGPVIEALNRRDSESGENGERDLPDKRPAVRLNFNNGRKMIGDSLDLRLWNRGTGRISSWFGRLDVNDEKKKRAEYILRQSMDNPLDLPQL